MESRNNISTVCMSSFRLRSPSLNSLRLRRVFDVFDKNGDGMITADEMHRALNVLGLDADLSELESVIKSYIDPGNQGLKFENFLALHISLDKTYFGVLSDEAWQKDQEDAELSEAFKVFDDDRDGYISASELQVVLAKLGFNEGNEIHSCQKMISSVDSNHDGRVDFSEFKHMMRGGLVRS